jgi:toxin ParE1/3/4
MARKVVWTEPAWEDLEAAANYIARDSKNYAATFVQGVKDAAASLAELAERGQVVPEFRDATIRELLVRPYRLIYKLLDDQIIILALVHGAQRLWRV